MKKLAVALVCLVGIASSAHANDYTNPRAINPYGNLQNIWSDTTAEGNENANRFCIDQNDGNRLSWTFKCGEDESSYLDWQSGAWVIRSSGSKNYSGCVLNGDGYPILNTVRCGWVTPTVVTAPVFATRQVFADQTNANAFCVTKGKTSAKSFTTASVSNTTIALVAFGVFWDFQVTAPTNVLRNVNCQ